jgi:NAD(P)-dependent dehydrogenase (short-subunit alcohol dehydrogenase family)
MSIDRKLLDGKVAVVTGGAGGIGGAICTLFAEHGADVVIADIDGDRTRQIAKGVRKHGRQAVSVVGDLTKKRGVDRLVKATNARFGRADILINGLGHHLATGGPFEQSTEAQWRALYEVNLLHVFRVTQAFVPGMKERGWGRIVNFSSVEGVRSAPALAVYASFKRAIDGFTKSLAVDLARYGILVNALGVDKTKAYQVGFYELPPEYEELVGTFIPAGRYADGLDVAKAALFLASDLNTWAVGHTLITDGGTLAAGGWFRTPKRWTNQPLLTQYIEKDPAINERRPPMVQ